MYNILTDSVISITTRTSPQQASLPEVCAALVADEVAAFPALRPHQRHAWHAFLVQLGAMAMRRADVSKTPVEAARWAELIRGLTPGYPDDEPWQLVVDDITKPAFMQPSASSPDLEKDYKNAVATPDELDMLVMSKNHDLKATAATRAGTDDWIFALIDLQTMEGFGGAGNYGISRMNGGLGSRPAFSLAPPGGPGAHVKRDIEALLSDYPVAAGEHELLWLLPWDGASAQRLLPTELAPLYIEVCRRIRLRRDEAGNIHAIRTSSKAARIEGKEVKGRTGDPWTPHNPNRDGLPLTLAGGGFNYKRVKEYLTDWDSPDLLKPTIEERRSDETMQLVARGMVRGQGKTEGYHERSIPIRSKARNAMLQRGGGLDALGELAQERINQVGIVQGILRHAVATFAAKGKSSDTSPEQRALANDRANRLDEIVDRDFFEALQDEFEIDDAAERERIRSRWLMNGNDGVVDHAVNILAAAQRALPCQSIHRYKARVRSDSVFWGRLRGPNGLPALFDRENVDQESDE